MLERHIEDTAYSFKVERRQPCDMILRISTMLPFPKFHLSLCSLHAIIN